MSRLELLAELQDARPAAPAQLRERVHALTAAEPPARRRRRPSWRLAVVVVATAAVAVAAAVVATRNGEAPQPTVQHGAAVRSAIDKAAGGSGSSGAATVLAPATTHAFAPTVPAPSGTRLQNYDATLSLRVRDGAAVSASTKRAVRIARSLGGFAASVSVDVTGGGGSATLRLRVPVTHVGDAVQRLSALGTITAEDVSIEDAQAGVNALDRQIARLQRQLRGLRAQEQTPAVVRRIATLTAQVQRLQRSRAASVRQARLATIALELTTRTPPAPPKPVHHGPLHGAVVALRDLGIGAVYALVVGGPVALVLAALWLALRLLRRRAEHRLLER
jgi:hypothetical protein